MVDMDTAGTAKRERDVYMQIAFPDHFVTVFMQFLKRAWPWLEEHLKNMPDYDPQRAESGRDVLPVLPTGAAERVCRS